MNRQQNLFVLSQKQVKPVQVLLQHIADCIRKNALFTEQDRILVGISGGPDSVILAYALYHLGYQIGLAHVNYQARGKDSEDEEVLIRQYAARWQVPVYVHRCALKELTAASNDSFQVVAREVRYTFFESLLATQGYTHCATAHHADDQTESLLLSLLRGNSSAVFKGIPVQRGPYVRPLIHLKKTAIIDFLDAQQLPYSIDYTNLENDYLRNRVRNQVLPLLSELNPAASDQLTQRFAWYELQREFIEKQLAHWYESSCDSNAQGQTLDWTGFVQAHSNEHLPLLLAFTLEKWGLHGHTLWAAMELRHSQTGKSTPTNQGTVVRTRTGLQLLTEPGTLPASLLIQRFEGEQTVVLGDQSIRMKLATAHPVDYRNPRIFYLDADRLSWPLVVRSWQQGDRMTPYGMKGQKKLSDIFIDEKYSLAEKGRAVVIEDQEKIVALSGFRIADEGKVRAKTQHVLRIEILPEGSQ